MSSKTEIIPSSRSQPPKRRIALRYVALRQSVRSVRVCTRERAASFPSNPPPSKSIDIYMNKAKARKNRKGGEEEEEEAKKPETKCKGCRIAQDCTA